MKQSKKVFFSCVWLLEIKLQSVMRIQLILKLDSRLCSDRVAPMVFSLAERGRNSPERDALRGI